MLDKTLDKLRDKTLSFGCLLEVNFYDNEHDNEHDYLIGKKTCCMVGNSKFIVMGDLKQFDKLSGIRPYDEEFNGIEIIGHPLTRGRILYLRSKINQCKDWFSLEMFFNEKKEFYNQTELERQQSPHRPELKELLIQFSNYL